MRNFSLRAKIGLTEKCQSGISDPTLKHVVEFDAVILLLKNVKVKKKERNPSLYGPMLPMIQMYMLKFQIRQSANPCFLSFMSDTSRELRRNTREKEKEKSCLSMFCIES